MAIVKSIGLFFKDGTSDKVYNASIEESGTGYVVNFSYGRRGSALTQGTKTQSPVDLIKAETIYEKLVSEKSAKGYTTQGDGILFAGSTNESRQTGLVPQLLNPITEDKALELIDDPNWVLQEKIDGKRIMVRISSGVAEGSNRKGLSVALPTEIATVLGSMEDCVLDGELLTDRYVVFDLLEHHHENLRERPYVERYSMLIPLVRTKSIRVVELAASAWAPSDKRRLWEELKRSNKEGGVFKYKESQSVAGRPASGGNQLKCKFYATATCMVEAINEKRSVALMVCGQSTGTFLMVGVGNVTIPPNKEVPPVGSLVEIRYLYAYKNGSLYQPIYLGQRDDLLPEDADINQLKYKAEDAEDE